MTPDHTTHPETDIPTEFNPSAEFSVAEGPRDVGMVFIGASLSAGYGDPKGLGWVSRVVGRTQHPDLELTAYNLGVRGDTSGDVLARWRTECPPRWKGRSEKRLVVSVGTNDVVTGMTMARSRLNLANILDDAAAHRHRRPSWSAPRPPSTPTSTGGSRSWWRPRPTSARGAASRSSTATGRWPTTTSGGPT